MEQPSEKEKAFMQAAYDGDLEKLIENKIDNINKILQNPKYSHQKTTALNIAASQGHEKIVEYLLKQNADPNIPDDEGYIPLTYVIWQENKAMVKLLLDKGANPNVQDKIGEYTPLMEAAVKNNVGIVKLLLDADANPALKNKEEKTAVALATDPKIIGLLQAAEKKPVPPQEELPEELTEEKKEKAFIEAAFNNEFSKLEQNKIDNIDKLLLPFPKSPTKMTALMAAAIGNYTDIISYLLIERADPNIQNELGYTALIYASFNQNKDAVELLLNKKANPNITDNEGYTPLMNAAEKNNFSIVKLLLDADANPALKNKEEKTAVALATDPKIIELLQAAEEKPVPPQEELPEELTEEKKEKAFIQAVYVKDLDKLKKNMIKELNKVLNIESILSDLSYPIPAQIPQNGTALMLATAQGSEDIVEHLLQNHAQPNIVNNKKQTALTLAVLKDNFNIVKILITYGADTDIEDNLGNVPLIYAILRSNLDTVKYFLEEATDQNINTKNNLGNTPLILATLMKNIEMINYLLSKGADPTLTNKEGKKAVDFTTDPKIKASLLEAEKKFAPPQPEKPEEEPELPEKKKEEEKEPITKPILEAQLNNLTQALITLKNTLAR